MYFFQMERDQMLCWVPADSMGSVCVEIAVLFLTHALLLCTITCQVPGIQEESVLSWGFRFTGGNTS